MIVDIIHRNTGNIFPSAIIKHERDNSNIFFYTENDVILNVEILRDSVFRFRYTTKGYFSEDFSYAVDLAQPHGYNELDFTEEVDRFEIRTSKLRCIINKIDCKTCIYDLEGNKLLEDERGFHWEEAYEYGDFSVKMTKFIKPGELFYGLGDKATNLCINGKRFENWVTDQYAFQKNQDPLYKTIPFYVGLHNNKAYGIFFDNTFRSFFDFGSERKNVTSFWAEGGEMNYYFIYGPAMKDVVASYTHLTGKPELPPLWALGYQQSKWSYPTEEIFKGIGAKFRELSIPCDALYLDIDYMDEFRCFTWNEESFPHPKQMVDDLGKDGFKVICIIDPGIKVDKTYDIFRQALEENLFCRRADGPHMRGKVWPGECFFPDFTNPIVREWWSDLYKDLIANVGVRGIWNDMNEPAIMETPSKTFPMDVRHNFDGNECSHRKAHNIYGMQMARATYDGIKKYTYPKRPFCLTRSTYAGTQRYTSTWTGDSVASWEHLWIANVQVQRLSLCGFSYCGSDIGGFAEHPTPELYIRWVQLACFHAFFRTHSSGHHGDQEPWSFGEEATVIVKKFIELRYQLLPYLYTAFWNYVTNAVPIIKSLVVFDQEDDQAVFRTDEFIFGKQILVCPILEPNANGRRMYFPKGRWYNYWNGEVVEGSNERWVDAPLDTIPMFVLEGAIVPQYPVQQYVGEKTFDEITLNAYYKEGKASSDLFEDAHDGYDYTKGRYMLSSFRLIGKPQEVIITQHQLGSYETPYSKFVLRFIGLPFTIEKIEIEREEVALSEVMTEDGEIRISQNFSEIRVVGTSLSPSVQEQTVASA